MAYVEHSVADIKQMLEVLGWSSADAVFAEIPTELLVARPGLEQAGLTELELTQAIQQIFAGQKKQKVFLGAGAYHHYIPEIVKRLSMRGEWLTSYTPYQAEASQGLLEVFFKFQTMLCNLLNMEVANLSIYDGATALVESVLMAIRNFGCKRNKILLPENMHPNDLQVLQTYLAPHNVQIDFLPLQDGVVQIPEINADDVAAVLLMQPSFYGTIADADAITNWAHKVGALLIAQVNPLAMTILKEPGSWGDQGADIVCGEGQPLGIALNYGGPYFGFMATKKNLLRQLPGRIVGKTKDADGNDAYTLTLQTREQHIRRAKATSNICTNQGLMVIMAVMHMSVLGEIGLQRQANICYARCHQLVAALQNIPGIRRVYNAEFFHECVIEFAKPIAALQELMLQHDILFGYKIADNQLLINATEMCSEQDIASVIQLVAEWSK
jgi:glycine dehydrogenase subunit 1